MTFTATCQHCAQAVFTDQPQIGTHEVRQLEHHLLRRCRPDEPTHDDLGKLLLHFRVAIKDR